MEAEAFTAKARWELRPWQMPYRVASMEGFTRDVARRGHTEGDTHLVVGPWACEAEHEDAEGIEDGAGGLEVVAGAG